MPNQRKAVLSAGGNDCPRGPNGYGSSARTGSTSGLPPKDKSNGWPVFTVSWQGPRVCRRVAKEKLLKACLKNGSRRREEADFSPNRATVRLLTSAATRTFASAATGRTRLVARSSFYQSPANHSGVAARRLH